MRCAQCETRNPVGNKFCRECGGKLAVPENVLAVEEAARAEAERNQERAARLLTDAHDFADQNKVEQAILLAEEAAERWPRSTSAHALLASLYERSGERARAVAAMERVVELNPESAADRDRLERLRAGDGSAVLRPVVAPGRTTGAPSGAAARTGSNSVATWLPLAAAGMVGALVLGVGLSLAGGRGGARRSSAPGGTAAAPPAAAPSLAAAPATASGGITLSGPKAFLPPPAENNGADPFAPSAGGGAAPPAARPTAAGTANAPAAVAALPRFAAKGAASSAPERAGFSLPPAPVKLIGVPTGAAAAEAGGNAAAAPAQSGGYGAGVRIAAAPPSAAPPAAPPAAAAYQPPTPPEPSTGYIHITVRPARNSDFSGTPPSSPVTIPARAPQESSAPAGDPLTRAQSLQSAGRYRDAIGSYQSAISADPDSAGASYQGIALSQQRLGNDAAARTAYRQAISAYQSQAASGRDAGAAQRGIASCKAALEVLGGG